MSDDNLLFRAEVGGKVVAFDPWRVERVLSLELNGVAVGKVVAESQSADADASWDATERLYRAAREAFALPPVTPDGAGVGEAVVHRLLDQWLLWKAAQKKSSPPSPACSGPTAAASSPDLSALTS